ncbi:transcription factor bHLH168 [Ricinus communis]|uniref:Transcription factor, putative n=1 Tax=Ricinus communis TaxID=3988 RepID=B9SHB6_RICCO|nr:transcription factor bHLH168 [Ricinus communis]EEF37023.1 transcription factor, putative [Ricinus communis]
MEKNTSSSIRLQRSMKERDRRTQMRHLLSSLASVLSPQLPKVSMHLLLDEAISHVKQMHARIDELKLRKAQAAEGYVQISRMDDQVAEDNNLRIVRPVLDIRSTAHDSILEVNLISGLNKNFKLHDVICVRQEEGAQVTSFSSHKVGDRVIYTIKFQAFCPRIGIETVRVHERLKGLIVPGLVTPTRSS